MYRVVCWNIKTNQEKYMWVRWYECSQNSRLTNATTLLFKVFRRVLNMGNYPGSDYLGRYLVSEDKCEPAKSNSSVTANIHQQHL